MIFTELSLLVLRPVFISNLEGSHIYYNSLFFKKLCTNKANAKKSVMCIQGFTRALGVQLSVTFKVM